MYIAAIIVPICPKLPLNFYLRRPMISNLPQAVPSLNTEIQSKRDINKNYLILQCIKHKLILIEKVEKEKEICVHNAQTNSLKVVQTQIQWKEWYNIQTQNHIYIFKHISTEYLELKFIWVEVRNNNKSYEISRFSLLGKI